jgi:hypothetical protein
MLLCQAYERFEVIPELVEDNPEEGEVPERENEVLIVLQEYNSSAQWAGRRQMAFAQVIKRGAPKYWDGNRPHEHAPRAESVDDENRLRSQPMDEDDA